jgi:hypothetical protein
VDEVTRGGLLISEINSQYYTWIKRPLWNTSIICKLRSIVFDLLVLVVVGVVVCVD